MLLGELLEPLASYLNSRGDDRDMQVAVESLAYDSRRVGKNALFFAIRGERTDGHLYLEDVLRSGASAVASERWKPQDFELPWVQVKAIRPFMAAAADEFYERPSEKIRLIGVTGTNGKTTTTCLIHSILSRAEPALLLGTIHTVIGSQVSDSIRTTPEAIDIQAILARAYSAGCRRGVMEVSSHALALDRVLRCRFPVTVFTNLSQDHLDFHGEMESYFHAKQLLFDPVYNPGLQKAVLNRDDPYASRIRLPRDVVQITFGLGPESNIHPRRFETSTRGTEMEVALAGEILEIRSPLAGAHNVYNILAAIAASRAAGVPGDQIASGIASLQSVPGRFERVPISAPFSVVVDYAHTPHALENVLHLARSLTRGRVLCVFGCGGERDRSKRAPMGGLSVRLADYVIVTSDNPRSEEPEAIVDDILKGISPECSKFEVEIDRRKAIGRALKLAKEDDIVLIAGKGHETYQEICGQRLAFDDREVVREMM